MSIWTKLFSTGISETLSTVFDGIDKISTTKEEKEILRLKAIELTLKDRSSARDMFGKDSILQKIFALFFLVAWFSITAFLLYYVITGTAELADWKIALISSIWGGLSSKLNTIVDFLFGGSKSNTENLNIKK